MTRASGARPAWWNIEDWFRIEEYAGFADLDAGGWAAVLGEMHQCGLERLTEGDRTSFSLDDPPELWGRWQLESDGWWESRENGWQDLRLAGIVTAAYRDDVPLEEVRLGANDAIQDAGPWTLYPEAYPVLKIDLHAPDALILDAFKIWLQGRREAFPLKVRKGRGPKPKSPVTPAIRGQLETWARYRIAAVFDVDFWVSLRNQDPDAAAHIEVDRKNKNYPTAKVAELVFPDLPKRWTEMEVARHVSEARAALAEALEIYPTLALQANSEIR